MEFDPTSGRIYGMPNVTDVGDHRNITISATDGTATASLGPFSIEVVEPTVGSAPLSWTAPSSNEDGSPLTDLAGFKLYWGSSIGDYPNSVAINDPDTIEYVVESLGPGTFHFVMTSINASGVESQYSNRATKTIP